MKAEQQNAATAAHPKAVETGLSSPPNMWWNRKFANILILSISFMLVLCAFNTTAAVSNSVVHDMQKYGFYDGDGYWSYAIFWAGQLAATPFMPFIAKPLGGNWSMFLGGVTQVLYVATFELNSRLLFLILSAVAGAGMNLFWVGMGIILTANTDAKNCNLYVGVFWSIFNFSQIWGNIVVAVKFRNLDVIDDGTRRVTFGILIAMGVAGCIACLLIKDEIRGKKKAVRRRASTPSHTQETPATNAEVEPSSTWSEFWLFLKSTCKLLLSPPTLLSIGYFIMPAMSLTLLSSVIPTSIGFDKHFGIGRKQLIGIFGFVTGGSEIIGSLLLTFVVRDRISRTIVFTVGATMSAVAAGFSVLNMPLYSAINDSDDPTVLFGNNGSSITICIICAVLFGLSDGCMNITVFALMSDVFGHVEPKTAETNVSSNGDAAIDQIAASNVTLSSNVSTVQQNQISSNSPVVYENNLSARNPGIEVASPALDVRLQTDNEVVNDNGHIHHAHAQKDEASTASAFAVYNGAQSLMGTIVFSLSSRMWLNTYFYILFPMCVWGSVTFYLVERNYQAGRYKNYFRNLQA